MKPSARSASELAAFVQKAVQVSPVYDIHTHLYDPAFGKLLLWGIDDLLVYHYLVAEAFRFFEMPYESFWVAEGAPGRIDLGCAVYQALAHLRGLPRRAHDTPRARIGSRPRDLPALRGWFEKYRVEDYLDRCMELGGVRQICMTNSPFDDIERPIWETGFARDSRFTAALRIDPLLLSWTATARQLKTWGYKATSSLSTSSFDAVRRFLADWTANSAQVSHGVAAAQFYVPGQEPGCAVNRTGCPAALPRIRPALCLNAWGKRAVNPALGLAGDGEGLTDLSALSNLCAGFPSNKFLATVLARENQHELCVLARKFRNLHIFGCWWFTNVPVLVEEMTRMRLELLGLSFTPQHSDARVLDQLIYKWRHSRAVIGRVLAEKTPPLLRPVGPWAMRSSAGRRRPVRRGVRAILRGPVVT